MAYTGKCPYCGNTVRSDEKKCPHCGAENAHYVEDSPRLIRNPRTIDELREYCAERGMPLLRMRFFIGEDYQEPKAFGIYRDGDEVVVYKNKADGTRAIRYRGRNEAHAVHELHQKLLDECKLRGIDPDTGKKTAGQTALSVPEPKSDDSVGCLGLALGFLFFPVVLAAMLLDFLLDKLPHKERAWPQERKRIEERHLDKPIRVGEGLRYTLNQIRYGRPTDNSLSLRERQIKHYASFWTSLPRYLAAVLVFVLLIAGFAVANDRLDADTTYFDEGYYQIGDGKLYYHSDDLLWFDSTTYGSNYSLDKQIWFVTDQDGSGEWSVSELTRLVNGSGKQLANNHMKRYYLGQSWDPSFGGSDFGESEVGKAKLLYDAAYYGSYAQGYYRIEDTLWYRDGDGVWDDWYRCAPNEVKGVFAWTVGERPLRLEDGTPLTPDAAAGYFLRADWAKELGGSDCQMYLDSQSASSYDKGYYRLGDGAVYYNTGYSWYRDTGSGWAYEGSSFDTGDSAFASSYGDYYLAGDWDSDWGDQSYDSWYDSQQSSRSSSSSDSSSSWDSSDSWDSWDSGSTDWDSDW